MSYKIIESTDKKYMGASVELVSGTITLPDGVEFTPDTIQEIGDGLVRFSNSSYVVLTKDHE